MCLHHKLRLPIIPPQTLLDSSRSFISLTLRSTTCKIDQYSIINIIYMVIMAPTVRLEEQKELAEICTLCLTLHPIPSLAPLLLVPTPCRYPPYLSSSGTEGSEMMDEGETRVTVENWGTAA